VLLLTLSAAAEVEGYQGQHKGAIRMLLLTLKAEQDRARVWRV